MPRRREKSRQSAAVGLGSQRIMTRGLIMHKTKIRTTFTWILRCATVAAIATAGACDHSEQAQGAAAAQERPPAPVMTAPALVRDVPVYIDEIGRCVSREMVTAQPQVDGRVEAAHFVEGA